MPRSKTGFNAWLSVANKNWKKMKEIWNRCIGCVAWMVFSCLPWVCFKLRSFQMLSKRAWKDRTDSALSPGQKWNVSNWIWWVRSCSLTHAPTRQSWCKTTTECAAICFQVLVNGCNSLIREAPADCRNLYYQRTNRENPEHWKAPRTTWTVKQNEHSAPTFWCSLLHYDSASLQPSCKFANQTISIRPNSTGGTCRDRSLESRVYPLSTPLTKWMASKLTETQTEAWKKML
jgi:hypothetical protein